MPLSIPGCIIVKLGVRSAVTSSIVIRSDISAISSKKSRTFCEASSVPRLAAKTISDSSIARYCFSCSLIPLSKAMSTSYIFPTRSRLGVKVSSPSFHLAGQTSPGCVRTYWAARILSINPLASRPIPSALISTV